MAHQPVVVHRFDRIEVRPAQRELLVDGQPTALGARAFDLLLALIEHRDRVVSKNELLDLVWPGLVVEENNLQVQVSTLRKVLGAKAIATVPGRGYRFTLAGDGPAAQVSSACHSPARSTPSGRAPSMLGREDDLQELLSHIAQDPLVTLVGPGGIGKTTLARSAAQAKAEQWPDGCAWVELASLNDGRLVAGSIAQALNLQLEPDVDAIAALATALRPLQLLLVIDNAEHLVDALAPLVEALLADAPGVHMLVTSQSPLRVRDERVLRLEALAVPAATASADEAMRHGAVALFVERARAADRRFALADDNVSHVIEICRRLDGLPLALELAAARVPLLGTHGVAERLDDRFKLLAGGARSAPTRQQTLQAALDWSLALLPAIERRVFLQLGVFAGGFTLALAHDVLAEDGLDKWALIDALATLADHSLLSVSDGPTPRYALSETARAYALAKGIPSTLKTRHAAALRRFFEASPSDWLQMSDRDWLARYEPELDNLRAALDAAHALSDGETVVALVGAAAPLWHYLSLYDEARTWHETSETLLKEDIGLPLAARWWRAAQWAWAYTQPARSRAAAAQAHRLYRQLDDAHGLYAELTGLAGMWAEPASQARDALEQALAIEQPGWPARERAWGQRARAEVARAAGQLEASRIAREAELALRKQAGDERGRLRAELHLADIALAQGRLEEAVARGERLVTELRQHRSPAILRLALIQLAQALEASGDTSGAKAMQAQASALL